VTTPRRIALLHAYSADNRGDGLLVDLAIDAVRAALGVDTQITILAHYPESFRDVDAVVLPAAPSLRGYDKKYVQELRSLDSYDLVLGVGGGYLRFGTLESAMKAALVHGPQLLAASRSGAPSLYLPQSIGPLRIWGARAAARRLLRRIDSVHARDDRTIAELALANVSRAVDMAVPRVVDGRRDRSEHDPARPVVLSVRNVGKTVPAAVHELARRIAPFDGYVQSSVGSNNDHAAMASVGPARVISRADLLESAGQPRVVVAVRMHAALMALEAGHYVIHLAYERKGFSAFQDLGLADYVHPVRRFDPAHVARQAEELMTARATRDAYDGAMRDARDRGLASQRAVIDRIRALAKAA